MQIQPFLLDDGLALGTVYGTLLNQQATVQRLSPQFDSAPYKAAPRAPVLYLKPRNTWARDGAAVAVPADPGEVRVDASIGLVIGRSATRVSEATALDHVAGWLIASDLTRSEEHTSELQSQSNLVCRLLLEKKKKKTHQTIIMFHARLVC